jgi:hypothetical protein
MKWKLTAGAALVAVAVTLTSVAAGGQTATRQRVEIKSKSGIHSFVLRPLGSGPLTRDVGSAAFCCWGERFLTRDGQSVEINDPLVRLTGKRGTIELRQRIEWLDAGNGYSIGSGTWKVVRGTGSYTNLKGHGRSAGAWLPRGPVSWQLEGFLTTR